MIFKLFDRKCTCDCCKNKFPKRKMIKCRDHLFCSVACYISFVTGISHQELAALDLNMGEVHVEEEQ